MKPRPPRPGVSPTRNPAPVRAGPLQSNASGGLGPGPGTALAVPLLLLRITEPSRCLSAVRVRESLPYAVQGSLLLTLILHGYKAAGPCSRGVSCDTQLSLSRSEKLKNLCSSSSRAEGRSAGFRRKQRVKKSAHALEIPAGNGGGAVEREILKRMAIGLDRFENGGFPESICTCKHAACNIHAAIQHATCNVQHTCGDNMQRATRVARCASAARHPTRGRPPHAQRYQRVPEERRNSRASHFISKRTAEYLNDGAPHRPDVCLRAVPRLANDLGRHELRPSATAEHSPPISRRCLARMRDAFLITVCHRQAGLRARYRICGYARHSTPRRTPEVCRAWT